MGGGIIYEDLAGEVNEPPCWSPEYGVGCDSDELPVEIPIRNNVSTHIIMAGIGDGLWEPPAATVPWVPAPENDLGSSLRGYNLLYFNNGTYESWEEPFDCWGYYTYPCQDYWEPGPINWCVRKQLGGCWCRLSEIFGDPLFVDRANNDYHLQSGSPAVDAGDGSYGNDVSIPPASGTLLIDMGAYGGGTPLDSIAPEISSIYGEVGSAILIVNFSEGVYSDMGAAGDLTKDDFTLTDIDDERSITGVTHTAGDAVATLTLISTLDSSDDLGVDTIAAKSNEIYDAADYPMDTTPVIISGDTNPPLISDQNPANGSTDVAVTSNLTFTLSDSVSGIDWSTFQIQLSGDKGYSKTYTAASPEVSKAGIPLSYDVQVNPDTNFETEELITVTVNVDDVAGNSLTPPAWSFTTEADPTKALWHFDESSGNTAYDATDNDNDGLLEPLGSEPSWGIGAGISGNDLVFNGSNSRVRIPYGASLDFADNSQFSVEAWVKPDTVHDGAIIYREGGWLLRLTPQGVCDTYVGGEDTGDDVCLSWVYPDGWRMDTTNDMPPINEWVYIVATYDSGLVRLYINAQESDWYCDWCPGRSIQTTNDHYIGYASMASPPWPAWSPVFAFYGEIDEVQISRGLLTAAEILDRYNEVIGP